MQDLRVFISQLYKQTYKKLFRVAFYMTRESELAEDLVQDTFMIALSHLPELRAHPQPEAWLMLTLRNLARNELRRAANESISLYTLVDEPAAAAPDSFESLLPIQLTAEEKTLLGWRFKQQMSYREISGLLGIPESSCRSRVSRIIAKCRKYLEEMDV